MTHSWSRLSYLYAAAVAVSLGYFLLRIPIQVTDSFANIAVLDRPFWALMHGTAVQPGYLRPGLWAELKLVYDLSGGDYTPWFRWTQVLQVAVVLWLFVRLLQPKSFAGALVVPLAIAVLVGGHTFAWTVREAFPINTFLTILVCCLAAANLALLEPRRWHDAAVTVLVAVAVLTVESGLLAGGIVIVAWLLGARGVSRRGVIATVTVIALYFAARSAMAVGVPPLVARDAGFGFARHDGREIVAMFSGREYVFYAYNVISSIAGALFAEPRDGVWRLTAGIVNGRPEPSLVIGFLSSTLGSVLIARYAWIRRRAWWSRQFGHRDRLVVLSLALLLANAAISFAYTKDTIMSPAGVFLALAVAVAARDLVEGLQARGARANLAAALLLALLATTWGIRQVGLHAGLARTAVQVREQWAYIDDQLARWGYRDLSPQLAGLRQRLRDEAVLKYPGTTEVGETWTRWLEVE